MPKNLSSMHKKMNHKREWYWNLNIHRNQMALANVSASTGVHLPTYSTCYTNSVITDDGLCVGMRNVQLNTENQPYFGKALKIPNCCSNLNVVGQHNEQIWAIAYDRMKYSVLPDQTVSDRSTVVSAPIPEDSMYGYAYPAQPPSYYQDNMRSHVRCDHTNMDDSRMCAGSNPFHLFGDRAKHPAMQLANMPATAPYFEPIDPFTGHIAAMEMLTKHGHRHMHMNGDIIVPRHGKPRHFNNICRLSVCGPTSSSLPLSSSSSSAASSPYFGTTANRYPFRERDDDNVSCSDHVAPPKKKWMKSYMQSNCTYCIDWFL